jgi:uncharacterized protein YlzI (FlbEa/FlbD family)
MKNKGVVFTNLAGGRVWINTGDFIVNALCIDELNSPTDTVTQIIGPGFKTQVKETFDGVMEKLGLSESSDNKNS